jgi:predicted nucleotidyltransferase/DNA-binding XRE family transcriptional regulator
VDLDERLGLPGLEVEHEQAVVEDSIVPFGPKIGYPCGHSDPFNGTSGTDLKLPPGSDRGTATIAGLDASTHSRRFRRSVRFLSAGESFMGTVYLKGYTRRTVTDVANLIRRARNEAGLTQAELAAATGTSQPALARYETGASLPTLPTLERLLAACGRRMQLDAIPRAARPQRPTSIRSHLGPGPRLLRRHRRRLLQAGRARGVRRIRVFGSLARGEATSVSDVDLLVDLERDRTLLDLAAFRREASEILRVPVDVATVDMLKERVRTTVLSEAVPL